MTTTRPAESLSGPTSADTAALSAELGEMIARADALDAHLAALDARCVGMLVEAEIARLERHNPYERAALACFADVSSTVLPECLPHDGKEWAL